MLAALHQRLLSDRSITVTVRARPGSPVTKLKDILADGSLKIDLKAVPEDGEANQELIRFLQKEFNADVEILSGATARLKLVRISA